MTFWRCRGTGEHEKKMERTGEDGPGRESEGRKGERDEREG